MVLMLNIAEAVRYYRMAADQGHGSAQFALGVRYMNGVGVECRRSSEVLSHGC